MTHQLEYAQDPHHSDGEDGEISIGILKIYFRPNSAFRYPRPRLTSCSPDEPDDLSGLADDEDVLELGEEEGEVEGHDGQQVHEVHRALEELPLAGRAYCWTIMLDRHISLYPYYRTHQGNTEER